MLHQSRILAAVMLTAVLTCTPLAVANDGDPMTVTKYQQDTPIVNQVLTNDCNGDQVTLNGVMHFDYFFATDADGDRTHYDVTSTERLTGVGQPTGANYVASEKFHENDVTRFGQASDTRQTFKSRLVAQGPTPDLITRHVVRVIIDRTGTIRVNIDKSTASCR
jgi:hypothetical protein